MRRTRVKFGVDSWVGCGNDYRIPDHITLYLLSRGFFDLSQIANVNRTTIWHQVLGGIWILGKKMQVYIIWDLYIDKLRSNFVRLKNEEDQLAWSINLVALKLSKFQGSGSTNFFS